METKSVSICAHLQAVQPVYMHFACRQQELSGLRHTFRQDRSGDHSRSHRPMLLDVILCKYEETAAGLCRERVGRLISVGIPTSDTGPPLEIAY